MESMLDLIDLVHDGRPLALGQAHSPKMLIGFGPAAESRLERSSKAPGVGLGRNCRSLLGKRTSTDGDS